MVLPKKLYDWLKFLAQVLLPALGTLYVGLAVLWGLPNPDQVSGSVLAIDTFLGVLLGLSSSAYNKSDAAYDGILNVEPSEDEDEPLKMSFELKDLGAPQQLKKGDTLTFKVDGP